MSWRVIFLLSHVLDAGPLRAFANDTDKGQCYFRVVRFNRVTEASIFPGHATQASPSNVEPLPHQT